MAIKNTGLGGTDWADDEVLYAADLNDTFNAVYLRFQGLFAQDFYTISFTEFTGDVSWLSTYLYSKNTYSVETSYADTLNHNHPVPSANNLQTGGAGTLNGYWGATTGTTNAIPTRVTVGTSDVTIYDSGIPTNSCVISTVAKKDVMSNLTLQNNDKYFYLTMTIGSIGATGGAANHNHSFTTHGYDATSVTSTSTSITAVNNTYDHTKFYVYKNTGSYDISRDFLPVGTYLLFIGTAPDIPANYSFVTDKNTGLMLFANASYNTASGTGTHIHSVASTNTNYNNGGSTGGTYATEVDAQSHMPPYVVVGLIKKDSMT